MLLGILLTAQILVSVALIVVVLLQRSEGGALSGLSGGPSGFMTARGAGDLLTRTTWILGFTFFVLGLALTFVSGRQSGSSSVVDRVKVDAIDPSALDTPLAPAEPATGAPIQPPTPTLRDPLSAPAPETTPSSAPAPITVPAPAAPKTAP
jgi:preprotein translocase subunit SecG